MDHLKVACVDRDVLQSPNKLTGLCTTNPSLPVTQAVPTIPVSTSLSSPLPLTDTSKSPPHLTTRTGRRLPACFTTAPHRVEVCRQFHGRIQHPRGKTRSFIRELRRLCAEGFTDDTPEVREQRILQQAPEGTRDQSTRRAFPTADPTSIQEALDRAGTTEQVNGVLEKDQQYQMREIAPVEHRR
ncbi:hypothetical protein EG68_11599 [Paragonimus skrjabini miyazakii]|uniref:Uncharacterized protein n=1 Tax=Paragonimus skrjabini miyazakii TaxID=59628 RepID=A0A8S9YHB3_9TREM|nr:hypothetical protein EG68_11599 [Paragonimus skrjabini miyazakii]